MIGGGRRPAHRAGIDRVPLVGPGASLTPAIRPINAAAARRAPRRAASGLPVAGPGITIPGEIAAAGAAVRGADEDGGRTPGRRLSMAVDRAAAAAEPRRPDVRHRPGRDGLRRAG